MLQTEGKQYHIPAAPGEVGKYCILPGDPGRCEKIAKFFDNPTYLATVFKRETGLTIASYIMHRRIDTACNMLRYSEYSASQISEILAFSSQSYFIRCFKQIKRMTPYEYVQRHSEENIRAARKKDLNRSEDSVYAWSESETTPPSPSGTK